ncbi:MAG TPA: WD40 repeat domain-containing protein, partial [Anaerolineaceae bacterium]
PDGALLKTFQSNSPVSAHPYSGQALFFDSTGKWMANRSGIRYYYESTEPITVWDVKRGVAIARYERPVTTYDPFYRMTAAFHGSSLLMLYSDGKVTRWDFTLEKEERLLFRLTIPAAQHWTLGWSQDGKRMVYSGSSGGVFVYETASGKLVAQFPGALDSPALNADGSRLAFFDNQQNEVQVVELASEKVILRLPRSTLPGGVAFTPDGFFLAYSLGTKAAIVDLRTNQARTLEPLAADKPAEGSIVSKLIWSPDGQALIVATTGNDPADGIGGKIVLWQRNQNNFNEIFSMDNMVTGDLSAILAEFNPSGNLVAIQKMIGWESDQREIIIYNLVQHAPIQNFVGYRIGAWMDQTNLLAINLNLDNQLIQLNVTSGEKTLGKGKDINNNAYSPNGILYLNSELPSMGRIAINYWRTGETLSTGDHGSQVSETLWSPDGHWVGSVGIDGTVRAWPVEYRQ